MLKGLKRFLYRPTENLVFKDGKCLLLESDQTQIKFYPVVTGGITTFTALSAISLLFGPVGVIRTAATALAFGTSLLLSRSWNEYSKLVVKRIYLLNDGKTIEIVNFGIMNNVLKFKIEDLKDPETSESTKLKMKELGSWVIETKQDSWFVIQPQNQTYYPDVLKAVFKAENIDLSESYKQDVIDIK